MLRAARHNLCQAGKALTLLDGLHGLHEPPERSRGAGAGSIGEEEMAESPTSLAPLAVIGQR